MAARAHHGARLAPSSQPTQNFKTVAAASEARCGFVWSGRSRGTAQHSGGGVQQAGAALRCSLPSTLQMQYLHEAVGARAPAVQHVVGRPTAACVLVLLEVLIDAKRDAMRRDATRSGPALACTGCRQSGLSRPAFGGAGEPANTNKQLDALRTRLPAPGRGWRPRGPPPRSEGGADDDRGRERGVRVRDDPVAGTNRARPRGDTREPIATAGLLDTGKRGGAGRGRGVQAQGVFPRRRPRRH